MVTLHMCDRHFGRRHCGSRHFWNRHIKMAFRWRADDSPQKVVFGSSLLSSTKTNKQNKRCQSWTPSDKTFWIRAWYIKMCSKYAPVCRGGHILSFIITCFYLTCNFGCNTQSLFIVHFVCKYHKTDVIKNKKAI